MSDALDRIEVLLEHYAAHGAAQQRRLALVALMAPAPTRLGRLEQLFGAVGPEIAAAAFRRAFPGCEIDDPLASDMLQ